VAADVKVGVGHRLLERLERAALAEHHRQIGEPLDLDKVPHVRVRRRSLAERSHFAAVVERDVLVIHPRGCLEPAGIRRLDPLAQAERHERLSPASVVFASRRDDLRLASVQEGVRVAPA